MIQNYKTLCEEYAGFFIYQDAWTKGEGESETTINTTTYSCCFLVKESGPKEGTLD